MSHTAMLALGLLALALGLLVVSRRVRLVDERLTRIALGRGYYGPPPLTPAPEGGPHDPALCRACTAGVCSGFGAAT